MYLWFIRNEPGLSISEMNCFLLKRSRRYRAELMSFVFISELLKINVHNIKIILIKFFQSNSNFILLIRHIKYQYIKILCFF